MNPSVSIGKLLDFNALRGSLMSLGLQDAPVGDLETAPSSTQYIKRCLESLMLAATLVNDDSTGSSSVYLLEHPSTMTRTRRCSSGLLETDTHLGEGTSLDKHQSIKDVKC